MQNWLMSGVVYGGKHIWQVWLIFKLTLKTKKTELYLVYNDR